MQQTILICDWCRGGVGRKGKPAFAVATLTLTNGGPQRSSPTLDLCQQHKRELERRFRPVAAHGPLPGSKHAKPKRGGALSPEEADRVVLAAIKKGADTGPKITAAAGIGKAVMHKATVRLKKKKLITANGWSKGRRYVIREAATA